MNPTPLVSTRAWSGRPVHVEVMEKPSRRLPTRIRIDSNLGSLVAHILWVLNLLRYIIALAASCLQCKLAVQ